MTTMTSIRTLADRRIPEGKDFLSREDVARLDPAELVRRVKALQPLIAGKAGEAEKLRRPVDEVWSALRASGIFYMLIPKRFGGLEADFDAFIDVGMAIGEADVSTAWVSTFCIEHNWMLSYWPVEAQEELWNGDYPYIIASYTANPPGKAVKVDGGYRVSAHWKWGSGSMHADWVMGVALLEKEGGDPVPVSVVVPASEVQIVDTWFMDGMASTGSNDVVFNDVFVPEHHAALDIFRGGATAQRVHTNPMYSVPLLPFLGMAAAIPILGGTRSLVKMYQERVMSQQRTFATVISKDKPQTQDRLSRADLQARTAEIMVRDAARRMMVWATLPEGDQLAERLAIRAQIAQAVKICRDTAMLIVEGAGSTVHTADHPFNRKMRDIITVSTHLVFEYDTAMEQHGRSLVGLEPNSLLI
jgi:3-hydroxy-9,10-secoandrosta-1,3,5(10)-triene-9,17-dione monooxygenase